MWTVLSPHSGHVLSVVTWRLLSVPSVAVGAGVPVGLADMKPGAGHVTAEAGDVNHAPLAFRAAPASAVFRVEHLLPFLPWTHQGRPYRPTRRGARFVLRG